MRVLIVGHAYSSLVNQKKMDAIAKKGVKVGLLAPKKRKPNEGMRKGQNIRLEYGYNTFQIYGGDTVRSGYITSYLFMPWSQFNALFKFKPDIIQIDGEVYSLVALQHVIIAKILRKRVIVLGPRIDLQIKFHTLQKLARDIVLVLTDVVLCNSKKGENLIRKWGFKRRVEIIPAFGVDTKLFCPSKHIQDRSIILIGYVGRIVYEKGIDVLLRAFKLLFQKSNKEIKLIVCGTGPLMSELQQLAKDLMISNQVEWLGAIPHAEVPKVMAQFDILVLPSRTVPDWKEMFGMVLIQAMAVGVPVVGSSCGAIAEVIGRNDVIFPEENYIALTEILEKIIRSTKYKEELSQYGIERAQRKYSFDCIAEQLKSIYYSLYNGGNFTL